MANYAELKDIINNPTQHGLPAWNNDANQIEGVTMKGYLLALIDSLTVGYQFMGVATPSTNPGSPDQQVFYLAFDAGVYANFGGTTVANGQIGIFIYGSNWSYTVKTIVEIVDDLTTGGSGKALSAEQGKVLDAGIQSANRYQAPAYPCFIAIDDDHTDAVVSVPITGDVARQLPVSLFYRTFLAMTLRGFDPSAVNVLYLYRHSFHSTQYYQLRFSELSGGELINDKRFDIPAEQIVNPQGVNVLSLDSLTGDYHIDAIVDFSTIPQHSSLVLTAATSFFKIAPHCFVKNATEDYVNELIERYATVQRVDSSETFSAYYRVTPVEMTMYAGLKYRLRVTVSGLTAAQIETIYSVSRATGTDSGSVIQQYLFTAADIAALKATGTVEIPFPASTVNSTYVRFSFASGVLPPSGNSITLEAISGAPVSEFAEEIVKGDYSDTTPTKRSARNVQSGGVYDAINLTDVLASVEFTATSFFTVATFYLVKNREYLLRFAVTGMTATDIDNLRYFRLATSTAAADQVFSHSFTDAERSDLKTYGYIDIPYTSVVDTSKVHIFFFSSYAPTEGNTMTVSQIRRYDVKAGIRDSQPNFLRGKTLVCFGDSITEFYGRGEGIEYKRYSDYVAEFTGMNVINVGIGGTRIRQRANPVIDPSLGYKESNYAALDIVNLVRAACGMYYDENTTYLELAQIAAEFIRDEHDDDNTAQVARLAAIDWSKVDYVTILGGTNDWHNGDRSKWGVSGSTDAGTTLGAINVIVEALLSSYQHLKLYWMTPLVRWIGYDGTPSSMIASNFSDNYTGYDNVTLKQLAGEIEQEVRNNHIPVADFYNEFGWNMYNFPQYFGDNPTHPFRGNEYIGRKLSQFLFSR